jgi:ribonuclease-3
VIQNNKIRKTSLSKLARLSRILGYEFNDQKLLELALTHRSLGAHNNERLEFLGDSIVNFAIAHALYQRFPQAQEGQLSRLRASLVSRQALASLAKDFQLGDYLKLGQGELKSGGFRRDSILADALEAIICAIFLDSDISTCQHLVQGWYQSRLAGLSIEQNPKDAKTRLQEHLQAKRRALPSYVISQIQGQDHDQTFTVECRLTNPELTTQGQGGSRRHAEQQAAAAMLTRLQD